MCEARFIRWFKQGLLVLLFVLAGMVYGEAPQIMLTGVMQSKDGPAAYVDGRLLRVGDNVQGYSIVVISSSGIKVKDSAGKHAYFIPIGKPEDVRELTVEKPVTVPEAEGVEPLASPDPGIETNEEWKAGISVMGHQRDDTDTKEMAEKKGEAGGVDTAKMILVGCLFLIGFMINFIAGIWLLVAAFQESLWWGFGCLFLPFVQLIFLFAHWDRAKSPFLLGLVGSLIVFSAYFVMPELLFSIQ